MLTTTLFTTLLFAITVTASAFPAALTTTKPRSCKKPFCTSFCPDGTPFDCCVTYVRDPCSDHQLPPIYPPLKPCTGVDDFECQCRCQKFPKYVKLFPSKPSLNYLDSNSGMEYIPCFSCLTISLLSSSLINFGHFASLVNVFRREDERDA
ncbi:hypothetical protein VTL71DRAFT_10145 [Oculimacula yallundae]|uniref:Uncharacterized protein n=1 Tax=Oculimacula yallundae TaxID=86028 RepID=A0ABR4BRL6_9HELO